MIVLDVETTGLDPKKNSILEIGALDFSNPENQFYISCQAKPNCEINNYSLTINGHDKKDLYDPKKPTQLEALARFNNWLKTVENITVIGTNPKFDLDFLEQMYKENNLEYPLGHRSIDLHTTIINHHITTGEKLPIGKNKRIEINSDDIMNYCGIPEETIPHNGLKGALYEAEAYSRLIYGKNLLKGFKDYPIPPYLRKN